MTSKIIMDSAGNLHTMEGIDFACVPLKIVADQKEFVDNEKLNVGDMVTFLKTYKGTTSTACPSVGEYLEAYGDGDDVYCITITSGLSGSYNAACLAERDFKEKYPDKNIHIFDSLSAGPEMALLAEKICEFVEKKLPFDEIVKQIEQYQKKTRLLFCLESLRNLANNGRVPVTVAKIAGVLGIRLIGIASEVGQLQPTGKARGEKKVVSEIYKTLDDLGYQGGKVRIAHCNNLKGAQELAETIKEKFANVDIGIIPTTALCSFYAEEGGLMVGFEVV